MSDLLGNLVSKALNLTPLVEPRPLSRFEPWQTGDTPKVTPLDAPADQQSLSSTVEIDRSAPPIPPLAATPKSHDDAEAQSDRRLASTPASDQKPPLIERIERVLIDRHAIESTEPDRSRRDVEAPPLTAPRLIDNASAQPRPVSTMLIVPNSVPSVPSIETAGQRSNDRVEDEHVVAQANQRTSITTPIIETHPAQRSDVEQPLPDRAVTIPLKSDQALGALAQRDVTNADRSIRPRPVPIIERAPTSAMTQHQRAVEAMPPAPPTVHVSIGRIEVRATLPTLPAKRSAATTSNTSLDDYLKWRSGDRR